MTFTNALLFINGAAVIQAAGNLTGTTMSWGNSGTITQTGGTFNFSGAFNLPIAGANNIQAWNFGAASPASIGAGGTPSGNYAFTGNPNFLAGHRPNWNLSSGFSSGTQGVWNLAGFTMVGNTVDVTAGGSPTNRYATLSNTVVGGQIDANVLNVGNVTYAAPYLDFTAAASVTLRGAGTIYNNFSVNNDGTGKTVAGNATTWPRAFKADTSTFVFDPTAGSASIDTGSTDSGLSGFTNNFALGNVTIGAGDTITLVGNQNVGGSANNALYVADTLRGRHNATLNLNTRNAYVNGALEMGTSPGRFTVSNGNLSLTSSADAHFEINGTTAGTGYDQLVLTGTSTLSLNNATLDLDLNVLAPGIYVLIDNQTGSFINGTFAGIVDGASISTGNENYQARITYFGNAALGQMFGGNDFLLQITYVPEPSTAWLLGLGLVGFSRLRRKWRALV